MASSDSDYDYTDDDDEEEETDYSDDDDDDDEEEEEGEEEDEDDSEYSLEDEDSEDEDEDEDEEEEEEDAEGIVGEDENADAGMSGSDEDEEVPALEHGQLSEPDEISQVTNAPDDPTSGAQQPSKQTKETTEVPLNGNSIPASSTDLAPAPEVEGDLPTSSLTVEMEKVKIEDRSSA